jgi:uncharacterized membrane protein
VSGSSRKWQVVLAACGLGISAYLTATHYFAEQVPLACSTSGVVDCEQVTSSAESFLGPFPVALLGMLWFGAFLLLVLIRARQASGQLLMGQMALAVAGLVMVFWLVYAELFLIGALCLWCTAIHIIVVALFLLTLWEATAPAATSYERT